MKHTDLAQPNELFSFRVAIDEKPMRIDRFLAQQFSLYSRSFFQRLIQEKRVTRNTQILDKASELVKPDDIVTVQFPPARTVESKLLIQDIGIRVLYEHQHFLIVYKPAQVMVHPIMSTPETEITLIDWLLAHYKELSVIGYVDRPGIVHRLDRDTSGILIIARTNYAHTAFGAMFQNRTIYKTYYAFVQGRPMQEGTITFPIGRDPIVKVKMHAYPLTHRVGGTIRSAITHYRVIEYFADTALLEIQPVTGRTHQIRVHCAAIGHPVIGDRIYGTQSPLIDRHALHAYNVAFDFEGQHYSFSHDMPSDMQQLIVKLRK